VHLDIWLPTANPFATPQVLAAVAEEAESHGIGTIWVGEHVVVFDDYRSSYPYATDGRMPIPPGSGLLEPFTTLAFLAGHTSTVRLGTAMVLLPQRNPVYTAKETSTLDWLSDGRVDLGIGVGWLAEEFAALDVAWPNRGRRCDEYVEVIKTLWQDEVSSFHGDFYGLEPCRMNPKPIQDPHPPIHIGGESRAALARVARIGQGWHTFNRTPDQLPEPLAELDGLLAERGRNRTDVRITVCPYLQPFEAESVDRYAEAGADAVAALLLPLGLDGVRAGFGELETAIDRLSRT
jgi:probable F420-dependent oxidoreductase